MLFRKLINLVLAIGLISLFSAAGLKAMTLVEVVKEENLDKTDEQIKLNPSMENKIIAFDEIFKKASLLGTKDLDRKVRIFSILDLLLEAGIPEAVRYAALKTAIQQKKSNELIGLLAFKVTEASDFFAIGIAEKSGDLSVLDALLNKPYEKSAFDFHDIHKALELARDIPMQEFIMVRTEKFSPLTAEQKEKLRAFAFKLNLDKTYQNLKTAIKNNAPANDVLNLAFSKQYQEEKLSEFYALEEAIKKNDLEVFKALIKNLKEDGYKEITLQTIKNALKIAQNPQITNLKEFGHTLLEVEKDMRSHEAKH